MLSFKFCRFVKFLLGSTDMLSLTQEDPPALPKRKTLTWRILTRKTRTP